MKMHAMQDLQLLLSYMNLQGILICKFMSASWNRPQGSHLSILTYCPWTIKQRVRTINLYNSNIRYRKPKCIQVSHLILAIGCISVEDLSYDLSYDTSLATKFITKGDTAISCVSPTGQWSFSFISRTMSIWRSHNGVTLWFKEGHHFIVSGIHFKPHHSLLIMTAVGQLRICGGCT